MDLIERVEEVLDSTEQVSANEMIELIGCLGNVVGATFQEGAPAVGGMAIMAFARELNLAMGAEVVH